jgi:hypothetical protein
MFDEHLQVQFQYHLVEYVIEQPILKCLVNIDMDYWSLAGLEPNQPLWKSPYFKWIIIIQQYFI